MKSIYTILLLWCIGFVINTDSGNTLFAQTNMSLLGHQPLADQVSGIWGYAADGREYALVGTVEGTVLVDVTNPSQPEVLQFIEGQSSPYWREIKTWQHYAYAVSETGGYVQIFDLSTLPGLVSHTTWQGGTWQNTTLQINRSHSLWIDENGIMYLNGTNLDALVMLDLNTDPLNPSIVGLYEGGYVHDCYARNDTLWAAEIYNGHFSVIDISNKANPVVLATQTTPNNFTHNTWLSDNGQYLFTTDEKSGAYVAAYDITDLSDIKETDRYRTSASGVIPHNTHVLGNFLVTSYYRDGVTIVDASDPYNLIEVGKYDTSPLEGNGFNGVWEVYPYLPSGNLLAGDMEEGLFVLHANYVQAAYLHGMVSDQSNGTPLTNVNVSIEGYENANTQTQLGGSYSTGIPTSGTYNVTYFLYGYESLTVAVNFNNGATSINDVALVPITPFYATIQVNDNNGQAIANAQVSFYSDLYSYEALTDANGIANVQLYYNGDYRAAAGKWGYRSKQSSIINIVPSQANSVNLILPLGYYDDFLFDFGWTSGNTGETQGNFERVVPHGIVFLNDTVQPFQDIAQDLGNKCFVTGNSAILSDNVNGVKTLTSPLFDATLFDDAMISYYRWAYFQSSSGVGQTSDDTLFISLDNGIQTVVLDTITNSDIFQKQWHRHKHRIADYIMPTNQMRLIARVTDFGFAPHVVDIAFDYFKVVQNTAPVAAFTVNQHANCGAGTFQLTDLSTGDIEQWQWTITAPSGEVITSIAQNPLVNLTEIGTYDVSLTVFGITGFDAHNQTAYINVYPEISPIEFNDFANSVCEGTEVWISCENNNTLPTQYTWSGDYALVNGDNTIVVNAPVGTHTYSVTATDANACSTVGSATIIVKPVPQTPQVLQSGNVCIGETINLAVANPQANETYTWLMPPTMPNTVSPDISFPIEMIQQYAYTLLATKDNCTANLTDTIQVFAPPQIGVLQNFPTNFCEEEDYDLAFTVVNLNTGIAPYNYEWNSNYINVNSFDNNNGTLLAHVNTSNLIEGTLAHYSYTVIDANGCSSHYSDSTNVVICDYVTSPNLLQATLSLQPNPTNDLLYVSLHNLPLSTKPTTADLCIYNTMGQMIWTKKVKIGAYLFKETLSLGEFAAGHYIFSIKTADMAWQEKLVILGR